jgi:hypothetical protein
MNFSEMYHLYVFFDEFPRASHGLATSFICMVLAFWGIQNLILKKRLLFKGEAWFISNHFVWLPTQGLLKRETTTWIYDYLNVVAIKASMCSFASKIIL